MAHHGLTGVLLVGGASRRFGSPKALARLDGETLAERGWRVLGEVCDERLAVGKARDELTLPFRVLDDATPVRAPMAGVVAGLRAASNELCVFLPVDCPRVSGQTLLRLATEAADAAVPQTGPLPGAYRRTTLPAFERSLAREEYSLRDALRSVEVTVVELEPAEFANVNTQAELRALAAFHADAPLEDTAP